MVKSGLQELSSGARISASEAIKASTAADDQAAAAKSSIQVILKKLPDKLRQSETIKSDVDDANEGVRRAVTLGSYGFVQTFGFRIPSEWELDFRFVP